MIAAVLLAVLASSSPELDRVASMLAERPVTVRCSQTLGFAGLVYFRLVDGKLVPDDYMTLRSEECRALKALPERVTARAPTAVRALGHEAAHLRGVLSHEEADCFALRNAFRTARLLGLSAARASRLARAVHRLTTCVISRWSRNRTKNRGGPRFSSIDGPITANNAIPIRPLTCTAVQTVQTVQMRGGEPARAQEIRRGRAVQIRGADPG